MSAINQLASTLSSSINSVQSQIADVQNQLAAGKKNLNPAESGEVTRLSAQVTGYTQVVGNVGQANNAIGVAQTALSSISTILQQMIQIANQASSGSLSSTDSTALNATFQQLLKQTVALSTSASLNGVSLLDGVAGTNDMKVTIDTSGSTTTVVNQAITGGAGNISGGLPIAGDTTSALGKLTNTATIAQTNPTVAATTTINVASALAATNALAALGISSNSISTAQSNLNANSAGLSATSTAASTLASNLQKTVDSIQNVDQTAMQAKLQQLNNQQSVDYYLVSQMNTEESATLTIFR
jgi:flagellin-like hook-associated protein FlgL